MVASRTQPSSEDLLREMVKGAAPHDAARFAALTRDAPLSTAELLWERVRDDLDGATAVERPAVLAAWCDAFRSGFDPEFAELFINEHTALTPLDPQLLMALMDVATVRVRTAVDLIKSTNGPGASELWRRCFVDVIDPAAARTASSFALDMGNSQFSAAAMVFSTDATLVQTARGYLEAHVAPREILSELVDAFIVWLTESPTDAEFSLLTAYVDALCASFAVEMVQHRPRLAAALATDPRGAELAQRTALPDTLPVGDRDVPLEVLFRAAAGSDPAGFELLDELFSDPNDHQRIVTFLARIVTLNHRSPDWAVLALLESQRRAAAVSAIEERPAYSAVLASEFELVVLRLQLIERCDNPALGAALLLNGAGRKDSVASMAGTLDQRGLWEGIDVAALEASVWQDIRMAHTEVSHRPVATWVAAHLGTSPTRLALALEMFESCEGTFGDIELLCDIAEL